MLPDNDHIINPLTGKRIKIGGETYFRLLRQGTIKREDLPALAKTLDTIPASVKPDWKLFAKCEDNNHAKQERKELVDNLPAPSGYSYRVVENKIYLAPKPSMKEKLTRADIQSKMCDSALRVSQQLVSDENLVQRLKAGDKSLLRDIKRLLAQNTLSDANLEQIKEHDAKEDKSNKKKNKAVENNATPSTYQKTAPATGTRGKGSQQVARAKPRQKFISDSEYLSTTDTDASTLQRHHPKTKQLPREEVSSSEYESEESDSEMD